MSTNGPVPLSRWEIVGAWLRIWTPPRDAQVPPVPWRKVAIAGAALAVGIAAFVILAVPAIDSGKEKGAAELARKQAATEAAERARLTREGRVHRGSARKPAGLGARSTAAQVAARHDLMLSLQAAVQADAVARVRAGTLRGPIAVTTCRPYPNTPTRKAAESDLTLHELGYECLARRQADVAFGYDFLAVANADRFTYTWCKVAPPVGEAGHTLVVVPVPDACTTPWPPKG
jgi:hypothetical protein